MVRSCNATKGSIEKISLKFLWVVPLFSPLVGCVCVCVRASTSLPILKGPQSRGGREGVGGYETSILCSFKFYFLSLSPPPVVTQHFGVFREENWAKVTEETSKSSRRSLRQASPPPNPHGPPDDTQLQLSHIVRLKKKNYIKKTVQDTFFVLCKRSFLCTGPNSHRIDRQEPDL